MQIQQLELQHLASIKSIDVLRAENDSLRKQLTAQLQEVSKNSKKTPDTVQSELERIKNDLRRIEVESKGRYDSAQATGKQSSENVSRLLQQTLAKVETLDSAHGQCKSVQDELAGRIKEIDNNCTTLTETLKTCKAEVIDTTQKIDSLDLESLDQMVNTWLDRKIPSRVKDHDLSINSIRQELSAIKDYVSKKTLAPGAILPSSVTEEFVASKIASLRKDVDETVKDANDCIADMIDETTRDVQSLKDGKLPERIAALEAAHRSNATSQTPDLAVASRVRVLEDQKLLEKINSLQAICMQRLQGLDEATRTMASRPHEPTSQVLHRDIQAVKNQLDGVAMQANNLDTQFKNVSTKDMARLILGELNQVNSKADTLGRQAIDTTEKLSSRFESLQSELARSQRGQDSLQARIEEVSNLVDLVVRSGARTGDKRPSEGSTNGINDPKRQRTGSTTSAQVRASPSSMPAVTNGAPRRSH
ncbi:hypothetical protein Micbo1qcDRAFT_155265 [Microdochium bolleyi]|uniref:Uncharacterized protein n=1 Tax=Microdochium bolleyi TaxID=196109 RepID=A0A136JHP0_9PEZI|nr:hypothetical protein Micbo1qcDRAFT_155265 [Microdochium bolleyi]